MNIEHPAGVPIEEELAIRFSTNLPFPSELVHNGDPEVRQHSLFLAQNYPNPFSPQTTIRYQLPSSQEVRLKVFNIGGQLIRTLIEDEMKAAGSHTVSWDGLNSQNDPVQSGVYFYRLETLTGSQIKRMVLIR